MEFHQIEMKGDFWVEKVSVLPEWTSDDEGRLIYVESNDVLYWGSASGWESGYTLKYNLDANSNRIINLASPQNLTDAVTKGYVDTLSQGLSWQDGVLSRRGLPGGSPTNGDRYISTATSGGWVNNYIYEWSITPSGHWVETISVEGYACWVDDENRAYVFNDAGNWIVFAGIVHHNDLSSLDGGSAPSGEYYHFTQDEWTALKADELNETIQDIVGGMVSGNTENGIDVTYQDGDGTLDFDVNIGAENLLPNTQWNAWNNGTLENIGSAVAEDDCDDDDTGDWTQNGDSLTHDTDWYEFATSATIKRATLESVPVTLGKLYKMSMDVKNGTASGAVCRLYYADGENNESGPDFTTTGDFVTHTHIFECPLGGSVGKPGIQVVGNLGGDDIEFKNFTFYEITPSYITSENKGPDGWQKHSGAYLWRQYSDGDTEAVTKLGSFYALKYYTNVAGHAIIYPKGLSGHAEFYSKFAGRTVTFGVWLKSDQAAGNKLRIWIDDGSQYSTYYSGSTDWEWIELTHTIASGVSDLSFRIGDADASKTAYISQPMLVFGSYIGEGNYTVKPSDPPVEHYNVDEYNLHGKAYVWDKDYGMVADNRPLENLLPNTQWNAWSNGTLENAGSALAEDDCQDDDTADWEPAVNTTLTFDTDHYEIATSAGNLDIYFRQNNLSYTKGKLYKIYLDIKNGTASGVQVRIAFNDGATQYAPTVTTTGDWVSHTFLVEAVGTTSTGDVYFRTIPDLSGDDWEIKNVSIYEVAPACVAADDLGPDGWTKSTNVDIFREHNNFEATTKYGSYYALKAVTAAIDQYLYWTLPRLSSVNTWEGKVMTFGCWVKSSTDVWLRGVDGSTLSSYHTGGGDWEWLEVTATVANAGTEVLIWFDGSGHTAYISQPMLVFGSSIGEGNYSVKPTDPPADYYNVDEYNQHGKAYVWDKDYGMVADLSLFQWDGGSTNLVPSAGRTSLEITGEVTTHYHDNRYYTETEIGNKSISPSFSTLTLSAGTSINEFSIDGTLAGDSDDAVPTEKAVKTYVDGEAAALGLQHAIGSFTRSTAGDEVISGLGFLPKLVLFMAVDGSVTNESFSIGWDDGTTKICIYNYQPTEGIELLTSDSIFLKRGAGIILQGYVTAFGGDGFTVTFTISGGPDIIVTYLAIA